MADVSLNSTSDSSFQLNLSVEGDISIDSSQSTSPAPRYVKLKDDEFIEAAGLERTYNSARKSSMEKLLGMQCQTDAVKLLMNFFQEIFKTESRA